MEAEIPPAILKEDIGRQNGWRWANEFLQNPTMRFVNWLDEHEIDFVPERSESFIEIDRRIVKAGLKDARISWFHRTKAEWEKWPEAKKRKDGKPPRLSRAIIKELLWRLAERCLMEVEMEVRENRELTAVVVGEVESQGVSFLPPHLSWVSEHPTLLLTAEDEKADPVQIASREVYETEHPCPNRTAMNLFGTLRGDKKAIIDFYKQVNACYAQEVKRTDKRPDAEEDEDTQANQEHVQSLEMMLGRVG